MNMYVNSHVLLQFHLYLNLCDHSLYAWNDYEHYEPVHRLPSEYSFPAKSTDMSAQLPNIHNHHPLCGYHLSP